MINWVCFFFSNETFDLVRLMLFCIWAGQNCLLVHNRVAGPAACFPGNIKTFWMSKTLVFGILVGCLRCYKFENLFTILWYVACYLHFVYRLFTSDSLILKSFQSFNFKPQDFPLKLSRKTEANLKFASKPAEKIPSFCFKNKMLTGKFFKKWAKKPKH